MTKSFIYGKPIPLYLYFIVTTWKVEMNKSLGVVKWYGGYNHSKGTENKFGFVHDVSGRDVYLHESSWAGKGVPKKDDIVWHEFEVKENKLAAISAGLLSDKPVAFIMTILAGCTKNTSDSVLDAVRRAIATRIECALIVYSNDELREFVDEVGLTQVLDAIYHHREPGRLIRVLSEKLRFSLLEEVAWSKLALRI